MRNYNFYKKFVEWKKFGIKFCFFKGEKCILKIVFTGGGMPKIDVFFKGGFLNNRRLMTKGRRGVKNPEKLMTSFMNAA